MGAWVDVEATGRYVCSSKDPLVPLMPFADVPFIISVLDEGESRVLSLFDGLWLLSPSSSAALLRSTLTEDCASKTSSSNDDASVVF